MFIVFVCVLAICLEVATAAHLRPPMAPIVMSFFNQESSNPRNLGANIEYHCMNDARDYVRGTYGKRGYFEGKVVDNTAYVNFWELTIPDNMMPWQAPEFGYPEMGPPSGIGVVPSSGSAVITYSKKWTSVDGPFWNSGSSNITNSYGNWGATNGICKKCIKNKADGWKLRKFRLENCLWNVPSGPLLNPPTRFGPNVFSTPNGTSYNHWMSAGFGNEAAKSYIGAYKFKYTDEQCAELGIDCLTYGKVETGNYGINAIAAPIASGGLLATEIRMKSGPVVGAAKDMTGTGIYVVFEREGCVEVPPPPIYYGPGDFPPPINGTDFLPPPEVCIRNLGLIGWYCTAEWNVGKTQRILVDCGIDGGELMPLAMWDSEFSSHNIIKEGYKNDIALEMEGVMDAVMAANFIMQSYHPQDPYYMPPPNHDSSVPTPDPIPPPYDPTYEPTKDEPTAPTADPIPPPYDPTYEPTKDEPPN